MKHPDDDPRYGGLRTAWQEHRIHPCRWRVPYTVQGHESTRYGAIIVWALGADDALQRAQAWLDMRPLRPAYVARRSRRARLTYGSPTQVAPRTAQALSGDAL